MVKQKKAWNLIIWAIVVGVVINGIYFYLASNAVSSIGTPVEPYATIATILGPVMNAINYAIMGFSAGIAFYIAKSSSEK